MDRSGGEGRVDEREIYLKLIELREFINLILEEGFSREDVLKWSEDIDNKLKAQVEYLLEVGELTEDDFV